MATQNLDNNYPKLPDPSIDYGEPNLPECTCGECELVWKTEDIDHMGRCPNCRHVQDNDEWYVVTRWC
jgi:hypothetical protein